MLHSFTYLLSRRRPSRQRFLLRLHHLPPARSPLCAAVAVLTGLIAAPTADAVDIAPIAAGQYVPRHVKYSNDGRGARRAVLAVTEELENIASAYLTDRNAELISGSVRRKALSSGAVAPVLAQHEERLKTQLRSRRRALSAIGERYTQMSTKIRVLKVAKTSEGMVLRTEENTRLNYEKVHGDEPEYTAFGVVRDFSFIRASQRWVLHSVRLVESDGVAPINEVAHPSNGPGNNNRPGTVTAVNKPSSVAPPLRRNITANPDVKRRFQYKVVAAAGYNKVAMIDYARRHALPGTSNPLYKRFHDNDCTNFISQAMWAGGWTKVTGWYQSKNVWWYNFDGTNQSFTWAAAQNWYWFATSSGRTSYLANVRDMEAGDVLQIDFDRNNNIDHTMIVTGTGAGTEKYLSYHSNDTLDKSLSSILSAYPTASYYAHRT